jgi:hypothetical protein
LSKKARNSVPYRIGHFSRIPKRFQVRFSTAKPLVRYNVMMADSQMLDRYFPEMRWRCLSLAADLDRVGRTAGAPSDPRMKKLCEAIGVLLGDSPNRAEQVQMIFSDTTPPPAH